MLFLYCITSGAQLPLLPAHSVFPVFPPYAICAAGLAAVVSQVPNEEYDPAFTPYRLMDRLWVDQRSAGYETVLATVARQTDLVPAAFCSVLETEEDVVAYLEHHVDVLEAQLHLFRERQEFWIDVERAGRRAKVESVGQLKERLCRYAEAVMDRRVAIWNRRQRVASWSFLVRRTQRGKFLDEAARLHRECQAQRLLLDCSGPWAGGGYALAPPCGPPLIARPA